MKSKKLYNITTPIEENRNGEYDLCPMADDQNVLQPYQNKTGQYLYVFISKDCFRM